MDKKFLKDLGLEEEAIGKILVENTKDVNLEINKLTAANGTIAQLQEAAEQYQGVDVAGLQNQLAALQQKYDIDMRQQKVESAVTLALASSGAKLPKAVQALLEIDAEKAEFDDSGRLKGLEEQLKTLKESEESRFLFKEPEQAPVFKGFRVGEKRDGIPGGPDLNSMTYSEMTQYLDAHPDAQL